MRDEADALSPSHRKCSPRPSQLRPRLKSNTRWGTLGRFAVQGMLNISPSSLSPYRGARGLVGRKELAKLGNDAHARRLKVPPQLRAAALAELLLRGFMRVCV